MLLQSTNEDQEMASLHVDIASVEWTSGVPFYGPGAVYEGKDLVQLKILCDRRHEGGGISWIARFLPPPGKLIKIVAVALSDEHVFNLEGGRSNEIRPAGEVVGRLRSQHEGTAAQRDDRDRNDVADHLHRGAGRRSVDGGGRYQHRQGCLTQPPAAIHQDVGTRRPPPVVAAGRSDGNWADANVSNRRRPINRQCCSRSAPSVSGGGSTPRPPRPRSPAPARCPGPWPTHRARPVRSPPYRPRRHNERPPSARGNNRRPARDTAPPTSPNNLPTITSSRSCACASRRLASPPFLPSVISFSATGRSSFAFGSVVVICSCFSSACARLRNIAWRWVDVTPSFRPATP